MRVIADLCVISDRCGSFRFQGDRRLRTGLCRGRLKSQPARYGRIIEGGVDQVFAAIQALATKWCICWAATRFIPRPADSVRASIRAQTM